jgi:DNA-binding CsgD family transcriptional regulator
VNEPLSDLERKVAALVAEGLSNGEIGRRLGISERAAAGHLGCIVRKIGRRNRVQVAVWAVKQGLY